MEMSAFTGKDIMIVITIVGILVLGKLVSLLVDSGYHKLIKSDYVVKVDCTACKNMLQEQIKIMKGLLLVVAVKVGVPEHEIRELIDK
jgi:hypothetical protein